MSCNFLCFPGQHLESTCNVSLVCNSTKFPASTNLSIRAVKMFLTNASLQRSFNRHSMLLRRVQKLSRGHRASYLYIEVWEVMAVVYEVANTCIGSLIS